MYTVELKKEVFYVFNPEITSVLWHFSIFELMALFRKSILIKDYTPEWARQFELLRKVYVEHLGEKIMAVEHVGSTAVPGLCAKPVIDIDMVINDQSVLAEIIPLLAALGYEYKGEVGIPDRFVFRPNDTSLPKDGSGSVWPKHHLYACIAGSAALRNHLLLRAALRADPALTTAYGQLKRKLAKSAANMDEYVMGKTSFITQLLAAQGMSPAELSAIAEQNKSVIPSSQ